MTIKLTLFFLLFHTALFAQPFVFPVLPEYGKSADLILPQNWKIIDSISGDLNNDSIKDMALVFEFYRPVKENRAYGDNNTEIITEIQKPRILAIYFRRSAKGSYRISVQNNNFMLRAEEGGEMGDPIRPMSIADNKLTLSFEGGGHWRWKLNYSFKYQDKEWQLTTANNYAYQQESGETNDKQYDFVNNKKKIISSVINNGTLASETFEQPLNIKTLRTFNSFKKPWTWELIPNEFL
ncbi:hypothetical protein ABDJ41_12530 [Pedobacter sp. ASV1-7]|uniref:hypothetical protein n=1 Tax=Pedobacter sp. ASV1-7 TaxID=3145237 RepID=UPI0032E8FF2D